MSFFLLIWSLTALGLNALASSMSKHQKKIFGKELDIAKTRLATLVGWVLLIIALILCLLMGTVGNMLSYWLGALTFSALAVGLSLTFLESKITVISIGFVIIALISGLISFF
ncbi:DUF3325 family protein [Acinetobacter sp. ASP199]|uniref:DUF3325 family protein n=1 Tax=unclassified Acinetobacter TaxID=196816 RepID=UPI001F613C93|nr:DUF3325 family protein [Acinetobacter sp. ASP199]UNT58493.1 DUF3325 family protein [Acinetobacter sp. ASP199]